MNTKLIKQFEELDAIVNNLIPKNISYKIAFKNYKEKLPFKLFIFSSKKTYKISFKYLSKYTIEMIVNKIILRVS